MSNNITISNLSQLEKTLNVKLEKTKTTSKKLSEKQQIMKDIKDDMHKLLITKYPQHYKEIETDVVVTSKEGKHTLKSIKGYYLMFERNDIEFDGKTYKGHHICQPTTYVKGGNSYNCLYYKVVGKTTIVK